MMLPMMVKRMMQIINYVATRHCITVRDSEGDKVLMGGFGGFVWLMVKWSEGQWILGVMRLFIDMTSQ